MMEIDDAESSQTSEKSPSSLKDILIMFLLPGGWGSMLLAIVFYLFFWRVDNEPGAKDMPGLLWTAVSFCSLGGLAFLAGNILLIMKKAWLLLGIGWAVCVALLVGAVALAPILLLFMV
ncbi:MAG: hypothetical protein GY943_01640 [Chloroflexi bacterium]|nr:hypothetical protein [Chloroflexota bacterium]